jgi:hypothetical protein
MSAALLENGSSGGGVLLLLLHRQHFLREVTADAFIYLLAPKVRIFAIPCAAVHNFFFALPAPAGGIFPL